MNEQEKHCMDFAGNVPPQWETVMDEQWLVENPEKDFWMALQELKEVMPHVSRTMVQENEKDVRHILDELALRLHGDGRKAA